MSTSNLLIFLDTDRKLSSRLQVADLRQVYGSNNLEVYTVKCNLLLMDISDRTDYDNAY